MAVRTLVRTPLGKNNVSQAGTINQTFRCNARETHTSKKLLVNLAILDFRQFAVVKTIEG
jgi:hypothetical protein